MLYSEMTSRALLPTECCVDLQKPGNKVFGVVLSAALSLYENCETIMYNYVVICTGYSADICWAKRRFLRGLGLGGSCIASQTKSTRGCIPPSEKSVRSRECDRPASASCLVPHEQCLFLVKFLLLTWRAYANHAEWLFSLLEETTRGYSEAC